MRYDVKCLGKIDYPRFHIWVAHSCQVRRQHDINGCDWFSSFNLSRCLSSIISIFCHIIPTLTWMRGYAKITARYCITSHSTTCVAVNEKIRCVVITRLEGHVLTTSFYQDLLNVRKSWWFQLLWHVSMTKGKDFFRDKAINFLILKY